MKDSFELFLNFFTPFVQRGVTYPLKSEIKINDLIITSIDSLLITGWVKVTLIGRMTFQHVSGKNVDIISQMGVFFFTKPD